MRPRKALERAEELSILHGLLYTHNIIERELCAFERRCGARVWPSLSSHACRNFTCDACMHCLPRILMDSFVRSSDILFFFFLFFFFSITDRQHPLGRPSEAAT
jgi:hypothetical protein